MIKMKRLSKSNQMDLYCANQPFEVIGRLELSLADGKWQAKERLFEKSHLKQYPDYDGAKAEDYMEQEGRAAYLAYEGEECVGQILLAKVWNGYAHIEDLSVAASYRGRGIGGMLLGAAEEWAESHGLSALSLECQDNNIPASRFLRKQGFAIGGVNTMLYAQLGAPYDCETAVFWYKILDK